ncbi:hypothetical protein HD599_000737 [Conyzicola lurida]|uniref:Uncharacterized protein n=1 Tax=Conyzicola lurida TaxID=1172621 RepID=A0A841AJ01_9MICO|nr:hypothetical protein [Conyzicola lurida]MBB5842414.1 hypothetical protein [Conyzicola lurida]
MTGAPDPAGTSVDGSRAFRFVRRLDGFEVGDFIFATEVSEELDAKRASLSEEI